MTDAETILALEQGAFERWAVGDLQGFLEISDPEVNYFDPFLAARLDGLAALTSRYAATPWEARVDHWEMLNPVVMVTGDMGVLTFNFVSDVKGKITRWNTTEVYRRIDGAWKIVHTHWSLTEPQLAAKQAAV